MRIWVDADACPVPVKELVIAAAKRLRLEAVMVANKQLFLEKSPFLSFVKVDLQADAADAYIVEHANDRDLVVTQDIPLSHCLVSRGVKAIDPRGQEYTVDNIGERLSMRDLMQGLRDSGEITGGPKQFGPKEKHAFAATFDRVLTRLLRSQAIGG